MRVVYLHQYFNTPEMPGSTRSYEMGRRLAEAGHEVRIVTSWREATDRKGWFVTREAGMEVHWLPVPYENRMGFADRMRAFVRFAAGSARRAATLPADVVFASSTPLTIALPGFWASRRLGVPLVFEVRDLWPDVPIAMGVLRNPVAVWLARRLERFAYHRSSRVVALAPGMKEAVRGRGVPADRIAVIPNGCDLDLFAPATEAGGGRPAEMDAPAEATVVLYTGTMGRANGVEYVPRLAHALAERDDAPPVVFYLIGGGSRRDEVRRVARELGVLGRSVHVVDALPKREVARWVSAADATIITYEGPSIVFRDSVANKFFDSLAASKPVFANYSGFATVTAREAGAGFILDRDPAVAAGQVAEILGRDGLLARAGAAAGRLARERFDRDDLARQLEGVIRAAVEDPDGAARG